MRPREMILVIDPDERERTITAYALEISGRYHVITTDSIAGAVSFWHDYVFDAVVLHRAIPSTWACPVIVKGNMSMAELLERLKVATAGKRGPKPGFRRIQ